MDAMRLGLVGLGKQGREHLVAASGCHDIQLVCGYDPSDHAFHEAQKIDTNLQRLPRISDFLDFQLDGLVLALPHFVYDQLWPELLQLHLPMLKEKPLGRNLDEAMSLLAQAKAHHCPVQTAIQRRHHPSYQYLKSIIENDNHQVLEASATLHLGFARAKQEETWRHQKQLSGGGALLDAGYHMVDLLHYMIGSFDTVSASLWQNDILCRQQDIDDQVLLIGRNSTTWITMDAQVYSNKKMENLTLQTNQGRYQANRSGVWRNGQQVFSADKQWSLAMQKQLRLFGSNIQKQTWHETLIWDQIPAMRVIEDAYQVAMRM